MRYSVVLLVCAVAFSLLMGGMVHALVPHDHGHNHNHAGEAPALIWNDLHAALRHEDKKVSLALPTLLVLSLFLVLPILRGYPLALVPAHDPVRGAALRRGIVRYRMFR